MNTRINRSGHIPANPNNHPDVAAAIAATIGTLVRDLLTEHPNIEFESVRIQTLNGNTAIVSGQVAGEPECPHCHAIGDQPHTDYCPSGRGWQHAETPDPVVADTVPVARLDGIHEPPVNLVSHLEAAIDAARVRAHERDHEVDDGKGGTWHQTGPEDAHYRTQCAPERCGWNPPDPIGEVDRAEQARLDAIANDGPAPTNGCCPHHQ